MKQPVWALTTTFFFFLSPHHLLFYHLFLQPPRLPCYLPHPSHIPNQNWPHPHPLLPSSSPTSSSGSAPLHLHSAQVPRCTCIFQCFFPSLFIFIFHTATAEPRLHVRTRAVKTNPHPHFLHLSFPRFLTLCGSYSLHSPPPTPQVPSGPLIVHTHFTSVWL